MVTSKTVSELWSSYGDYAEIANKLGQSTENAIKSSALFYQQGLDTAEALSLTEDTMKLATLSGQGFEEATKQMTAALRGFHMEMSEGSHITDVYSELAANAAADVHGIAYAMSKTASIANSAGMSFENTAAFLTNMIETTQEAPENIGTAMKTIIARFTELKENVSASESQFDDLEYNKVDKALKSVGISMKDASGQFRNLDDIFLELSSKWNTLDRNTQRYIATTAAGSRQQSRFIAMMEDYERTMELVETAQDSAGRSEEQFAKYADTLQQKINTLKNTWEQLRVGLMDASFFKNIVDGANTALSKISSLDFSKLIPTVALLTPMIKSFITSIINQIRNSSTQFQSVGKNISNAVVSGIRKSNTKIAQYLLTDQDLKQALVKIENQIKQSGNTIEGYKQKIVNSKDEIAKLNKELEEENAETQKLKDKLAEADEKVSQAKESRDRKKGGKRKKEQRRVDIAESQRNYIQGKLKTAEQERALTEERIALAEEEAEAVAQSLEQETQAREDALKEQENMLQQQEENNKFVEENAEQVSSAIQSVAQAAIAGIAAIIAGGEITDAIDVATSMVAATAVSSLMTVSSTFMSAATAELAKDGATLGSAFSAGLASTGVGLIIVAVLAALAALGAGISAFVKYWKKTHQSIDEQLKASEERLKEIESNARETSNQAKTSKEAYKSTQELKEKYEELNAISVKTTEQEQEYKEVVDQIREQFPEIVTFYDETTGKLEVQKSLWDGILQDARELAKKDAAIAAMSGYALNYEKNNNERLKVEKNKEINERRGDISTINKELSDLARSSEYRKNGEQQRKELIKQYFDDNLSIGLSDMQLNEMYNQMQKNRNAIAVQNMGLILGNQFVKRLNENAESYIHGILSNVSDLSETFEKGEKENKKRTGNSIASYIKNITDNSDSVSNFIGSIAAGQKIKASEKQKSQIFGWGFGNNWSAMMNHGFDQDVLSQMGITDRKTADDYIASHIGGKQDLVDEYNAIKSDISKQNWAEKYAENMSEAQKTAIEKFYEGLNTATGSELSAAIDSTSNLFDNKQEVKKQLLQTVQENRKQLQDKVAGLYKLDVSQMSIADMQSVVTQADNIEEKYGADKAKKFASNMKDLMSKYKVDMTTFVDLTSAGWDGVDLTNQEKFFKELREKIVKNMKCTPEQADKIVESYKGAFKDAGIFDLSTTSIESIGDKVVETFKKKIENKKDISTAIKSQLEKGTISFTESNTLKEKLAEVYMDAEKYLTRNSDGSIILDTDALIKDYKETDEYAESLVDSIIAANEEKIKEIEKEKVLLDLEITRLQVYSAMAGLSVEQQKSVNKSIADGKAKVKQEEEQIKLLKEENEKYAKGSEERSKLVKEIKSAQKELDFTDDIEAAAKKTADALEKIAKAEEKVADATKKLNEALYGTEYHKDALDLLYNYTTNLERLEKKAQDAKTALDDLSNTDDTNELFDTYLNNTHQSIVNRQAQNRVLQQSIDNRRAVLDQKLNEELAKINANGTDRHISANASDYYTVVGDRLNVNHEAIDNAMMPDSVKDSIHQWVQDINEEYDKIEENLDAIKEKEKELKEVQRKARENYIKLEEKVVDTLKEKYEEEIKNNENKNKALEESDNKYLEALQKNIDRQRKLRDEANAWDDLAEKQKKLSLMRRDTSGTNAKEVKSLQKDVEKTQQDLLDKSVDNIINNLKEFYDLQKETREAEIEYQKAVIDNAQLMREANELINSWNAPEDMYEFMMNNTKNLSEMSEAQIASEKEQWEELFRSKEVYNATMVQNFKDALETEESEITETVKNTSEVLTKEADRALGEVTKSVTEAIESAEKALADALKDLAEAQKEYKEATITKDKETTETEKTDNFDINKIPGAARDAMEKALGYQGTKSKEQKVDEMSGAARDAMEKALGHTSGKTLETSKITQLIDSYKKAEEARKNGPLTSANAQTVNTFDTKLASLIKASGMTPEQLVNSLYGDKIRSKTYIPDVDKKIIAALSGEILYDDMIKRMNKYASGGIVDYTGPAWVDGTLDKPEAFLSPEDTQRIGLAAKLLASLPIFNYGSASNAVSSNVGDTSIEIHINVDSLGSDYDVDQLVERVKNDIVDIARPTGTPVILNKR